MACITWVLFSEVSLCLVSGGDDCWLLGEWKLSAHSSLLLVLVQFNFEGSIAMGQGEWTRNRSKCVRKERQEPLAWKTNLAPEAEDSEDPGKREWGKVARREMAVG